MASTLKQRAIFRYLLRRHHLTQDTLGTKQGDLTRIVGDTGGLHAQDPSAPYLALWNRMIGFRKEWLDDLIFHHKKLVISHLMRVTLHIVTVEEFPKYFQATRDSLRVFLKRRGLAHLSDLGEPHKIVMRSLRQRGPLTISEIRKELEGAGLTLDSQALLRLVHYELAATGKIIRTGRRAGRWEWALTEDWLPSLELASCPENEAKGWLILKYLESYGPSSERDIMSWTWYNLSEIRELLNALREQKRVMRTKIMGVEEPQWICRKDLPRIQSMGSEADTGGLKMLPEFDPLTVGLRRRWRSIIYVPSLKKKWRPHPAPGIILCNSKIVGRYETWPYWRIIFNVSPSKDVFYLIIKGVEDQAIFRGAKEIRIDEVNGRCPSYNKKVLNNLLARGFLITGNVAKKEVVT